MGGACCSSRQTLDTNFSRKDFLSIKTHSILIDYMMEKMLGLGSYGEVRLGRHKRSKVQVAIKKIPVDTKDKELMEMIYSEIKILI